MIGIRLAGTMREGPLVYYFTLVLRLVSLAAPSGTTEGCRCVR